MGVCRDSNWLNKINFIMIQEFNEHKIEITDKHEVRRLFSDEPEGKKKDILNIFDRTCLGYMFTDPHQRFVETGYSQHLNESYISSIKYIKTDRWEYWILETKSSHWDKTEKRVIEENLYNGTNPVHRASFDEKILRYDLREEKFQYQEWSQSIGFNNKTRHFFFNKVWLGRVIFNMKNNSTLVRFKMKRGYRTQYLSLKNFGSITDQVGIDRKYNLLSSLLDVYAGGSISNLLKKSADNRPIPNKLIKDTKNMAELLKKVNGDNIDIPKKLVGLCNADLALIIAAVVKPNELNKVTQFIHYQEGKLKKLVDSVSDIMTLDEIKMYNVLPNNVLYSEKPRKKGVFTTRQELGDENDIPSIKRSLCDKLLLKNNAQSMDFFLKLYHHLVPGCSDYIIRDYVRMCFELGVKINLRIKSHKRLKEEHDLIAVTHKCKTLGEVKSRDWYKVIDSNDHYSIELIDSAERLALEGTRMKHCVTSYSTYINSGHSAVFHIKKKDLDHLEKISDNKFEIHNKGWTLEVGVKKNEDGNYFHMKQFRGFSNCSPPNEVINDIKKVLETSPVSLLKKDEKKLGLEKEVQQVINVFEPLQGATESSGPFFDDSFDNDLPF